MENDKKAELLMEHYKETFENILYYWKARNRLFVFILILLTAMALDLAQPGSIAQVTNAYIAKTLASGSAQPGGPTTQLPTLDFSAVGSLCWFALLCLVIQYYQRSIHVDRQYNYIHRLEEKLSALTGDDNFITREGKAYLTATGAVDAQNKGKGEAPDTEKDKAKDDERDERPLYLRVVGLLYIYVFPAALSAFVLFSVYRDRSRWYEITFILNVVFGAAILFYNILYVRWIKVKK
jgi:ABC-type multidrug transport system fused ATPase/permease subunit